jgi:hypothetical protein
MKRIIICLLLATCFVIPNFLNGGCNSSKGGRPVGDFTVIDAELTDDELMLGDMKAIYRVLRLAPEEAVKASDILHTVLQEGHSEPCCHLLRIYVRAFGADELIPRLYGTVKDPSEDLYPALYEGIREKAGINGGTPLTLEQVVENVPRLDYDLLNKKFDASDAKGVGEFRRLVSKLETRSPCKEDVRKMKARTNEIIMCLVEAGNAGNRDGALETWKKARGLVPDAQLTIISGAIINLANPDGFDILIQLLSEELREQAAINVIAAEGVVAEVSPDIACARAFIVEHSSDFELKIDATESPDDTLKRRLMDLYECSMAHDSDHRLI